MYPLKKYATPRDRTAVLAALVALAAAAFPISGCAALRKLTDPVTGLVKRGSCISIDLPPITLTPERTAAERQLVGENKELEPNGWLLASAQSASRYGRESGRTSKPLVEIQRLYRERAILEYYADFLRELQGKGALGETFEGLIAGVPVGQLGADAGRITRADLRRAVTITREVNEARRWIFEYYRSLDAKGAKPDDDRVKRLYQRNHWEQAPLGTWVRNADGRWVKRQ